MEGDIHCTTITVGPHEFDALDVTRCVHTVMLKNPTGFIAGDVIEELKSSLEGFELMIRAHQDSLVSEVLRRLAENEVLEFDRVNTVWRLRSKELS